MTLDLFGNINGVDESKYHPKFAFLKNELQTTNIKEMLINWTDGFVDRDGKFIQEFQKTFHSSFWEIYLYRLFTTAGYTLDQSHPMPDFIINTPYEIFVEAVIANIKLTGRKEQERTFDDQLSMFTPPYLQKDFYKLLDNAIIRYSNAISYKHKKLSKEYSKLEWVNLQKPFVLALASYDDVNYGREYIYPILALLYGLYYNVDTNTYIPKEYIIKPESDAKIPIGLFNDENYKNVSAIIFTCSLTLGKLTALSISENKLSFNKVYSLHENIITHKYVLKRVGIDDTETLSEGTFVFHNPNASQKLPDDFLSKLNITNFYYQNNKLSFSGNPLPLISRINTNVLLSAYIEPILYENIRKYNMLSFKEFYDIIDS